MPEDTKEQREDYVRGLLEERRGAESRDDNEEKLAAIDAELRRMGHEAKPPARRAETREDKTPARATRSADGK